MDSTGHATLNCILSGGTIKFSSLCYLPIAGTGLPVSNIDLARRYFYLEERP